MSAAWLRQPQAPFLEVDRVTMAEDWRRWVVARDGGHPGSFGKVGEMADAVIDGLEVSDAATVRAIGFKSGNRRQ